MDASVVEVPPKRKKQKVEGGSSRLGCPSNNSLYLEKKNRNGMCNYYKDYLGRKQGVVNVNAPIKCLTCDLGMHEECYYTYHKVREGVVLALASEINDVRRSHLPLKKWK